MTPERWKQVEGLFQSALDQPLEQREAFLDEACGEDASLRAQVRALLASYESSGSFIEAPAFAGAPNTQVGAKIDERSSPATMTGRRIGAYKIVREIGRGGMGAVYLAVRADDEFQRRVAIKLVKRGMDTDFILRRFRHERQILASFDHPNIGRLFDGGTTDDGLPYFVMEYIEGQPIQQYCDANRLSVSERLRLFRQVCSAVHYAHQNFVVHRDIKPGNILVTAGGTPKLLDFGIAKILNPELASDTLDPTSVAHRLMTPEYASPEQVRGEPATASSDIYSLGVLLYELLTGHRPHRLRNTLPHEMARIICEEEPERPSAVVSQSEEIYGGDGRTPHLLTPELVSRSRGASPDSLRRELSGDLDNITLKALAKDPRHRYLSVEDLSEDIWRHLDGVPVSAQTVIMSPGSRSRRGDTGEVASIAVLPFQNLSLKGEAGEEILGIGLADALITHLSNVKTIMVRPTSAVLKYTDGQRDLLSAGYELDVDSVLDGRFQHLGERIRVTVQLVSMGNGAPMWAAQFVEKFTDVLSVQDMLAERVAGALSQKLSNEERQRLSRRYTDNAEAYQEYLKGRKLTEQFTEEALHQAIGHFAEAIAIDPQYALAHAGVADYYNWLGVWGVLAPDKSVALAKESALRALEIDDSLAEAHASLAFARFSYDRDWTAAEQGFRRAIELNPNYATSYLWYALFLSAMSRHEEALAVIERVRVIEPLSAFANAAHAYILRHARHYEEIWEQLRRALDLDSQNYVAQQGLAWAYTQRGQHEEAVAAAEKAIAMSARLPLVLWALGRALSAAGRSGEALAVVEELKEMYRTYYVSPYYIGHIYAALDMRDEAFQWFEEAYNRRDFWILWLGVEPDFEQLHGDARFQDLLRRLGLQEIVDAHAAQAALEVERETLPVSISQSEREAPAPVANMDAAAAPRPTSRARLRAWSRTRLLAALVSLLVVVGLGALVWQYVRKSARASHPNPWRLTDNPATDWQPRWSPDGERIAFSSNRDGKFDIYLMEADGGADVRRLTHNSVDDFAPAWSPDSKRIAFTSKRDGNDEIYVMDADGGNQTNLTRNAAADSRPAWSPDGKRIAFTSNRDSQPDTYDIYVMDADGTNPRRLTDDPKFDSDPAWSPDGKKIAFSSNRSGNFEVFVMNADGTEQSNVSNNLAFDGKPVWSPDGTHLAFVSNRDSEPNNFDLYVTNVDGHTGLRKVTDDAGTADEPSWSPDGTRLVFQTDRDVNYEIYSVDLLAPSPVEQRVKTVAGARSIAVLPFTTPGASGNDQYVGVGLADSLTNKLGQISQIEVRPSSAVRRYLDTDPDPIKAGRELGVDYVLEGTIEHAGEHVQVTVKLTSVADGKTSWAEKFDQKFTDILSLQDSISERVLRAMTLELTSEQRQRLSKRYTENTEAYQLYLVGRYHWGKRTADGLRQAIGFFDQAIKKDEQYALAYAGLADCYALLNWYVSPPPPDAFQRAREAATRALALDDTLAEAHASLAFVKLYDDRDWAGAESEFRRAIELNPSYATAHHWYSFYLSAMGRHPEALEEIKRARELDPRSLIINAAVGNIFYYAGKYDEAIDECRKTLEMDQGFVPAYTILRWSYEKKGKPDDAMWAFQKERSFAGESQTMKVRLAHVYASTGKQEEARRLLKELIAQRKRQWVSAYEIAVVYAHLGDNDAALQWLAKADAERAIGFTFARTDPDLESLHNDPRFSDLLHRAKFNF